MASLKSIELRLAEKLRDKTYRQEFFRGLTQDEIAMQVRTLRKQRGLRQADLARLTDTAQSAISRLEQADYSRWGFNTLMSIADALDARVRFVLEPAEEAIQHFEALEGAGQPELASIDIRGPRSEGAHTRSLNTARVYKTQP